MIQKAEKPFKCSVCDKTFRSSWDLNVHQRGHTGEKAEKPFKCSICDKTFRSVYDLNVHQRGHTGEELFACNKL